MPEDITAAETKTSDKLASDRALMRWIIVACIAGAAYVGREFLSRDNQNSTFIQSQIIATNEKIVDTQAATLTNTTMLAKGLADQAVSINKLIEIAAGTQEWIKKFAIDQEHGVWRGRDPAAPAPAPVPMRLEP